MAENFLRRRLFYIPTSIIAIIFGVYFLTRRLDSLTIPFLCLILIIVTTLELMETKQIKTKSSIIKIGLTAILISLALWYQITAFIL